MQNVELNEINLPTKWRDILVKAGYITASEVLLTTPSVLASKTRLAPKEVFQILLQVAQGISDTPLARTATVMQLAGPKDTVTQGPDGTKHGEPSEVCRERRNFTVGDANLDALLGDGIQLGSITEIAGQSASGKSHLCLQLALTAQLAPEMGGVSGGTLYISSEGVIPSNRLLSLAQCLCASMAQPDSGIEAHHDSRDEDEDTTLVTPWDMLDNVHMEKAPDVDTLQSLLSYIAPAQIDRINASASSKVDSLPKLKLLRSRNRPLPIRLIVVDSIAAPFRVSYANDSSGFMKRAEELGDVGDQLKRLAHVYDCAILVVNQVSDVFERGPLRPPPSSALNVSPGLRSAQAVSPSSTPSAASSTPSTPRPPPPAHVQNGLPPNLYSRFQTPHFSGQTPSFRALASMGHSWSNIVNTRVMLWRTKRRRAIQDADSNNVTEDGTELIRCMALIFSPFAPRATVEYVIREQGVVSVGAVRIREPRWAGYAATQEAELTRSTSMETAGAKANTVDDEDDELWAALGDVGGSEDDLLGV